MLSRGIVRVFFAEVRGRDGVEVNMVASTLPHGRKGRREADVGAKLWQAKTSKLGGLQTIRDGFA